MLRTSFVVLTILGTIGLAPARAADRIMTAPDAMLSACWEDQRAGAQAIDIFLEGAEGSAALLMFSLAPPVAGMLPDSFLELALPLDAQGRGHFHTMAPDGVIFAKDEALWVTAVYRVDTLIDGPAMAAEMAGLGRPGGIVCTAPTALLLGGASAEMLDFDWAPTEGCVVSDDWIVQWLPDGFDPPFGHPTEKGEVVADQWKSLGVRIAATNNVAGHPDAAIVFDSANPTGGDFDLATPGYGPGNRDAEGKLLIIAENAFDADGDGLVDDPDDEAGGGVLRFDFEFPVTICSVKMVDADNGVVNETRFYDEAGLRQRIPFPAVADNGATRLGMFAERTRRLEIDLGGSGGLAYLELMPCPARVDFDWTTFAAPVGLRAGEVLTDQLAPLGLAFEAFHALEGRADKAVLFDTRFPTGGDDDLVTPGYGYGNWLPRRHVVVIAENDLDLDGDGYIDVPDDAEAGGLLAVDFAGDRWLRSATVLDIDQGEASWIVLRDVWGATLQVVPLEPLGDNSLQEVPLDVMGVRRFELWLGGSGALVDLEFCN